jgi:hypothetical protein
MIEPTYDEYSKPLENMLNDLEATIMPSCSRKEFVEREYRQKLVHHLETHEQFLERLNERSLFVTGEARWTGLWGKMATRSSYKNNKKIQMRRFMREAEAEAEGIYNPKINIITLMPEERQRARGQRVGGHVRGGGPGMTHNAVYAGLDGNYPPSLTLNRYNPKKNELVTTSKEEYLKDYSSHHAVGGAFSEDYYFERGDRTSSADVDAAEEGLRRQEEELRRFLVPPRQAAGAIAEFEDPGWKAQADVYLRARVPELI